MPGFDTTGLNPALLASLKARGYDTPTPIQAQAIPTVISGKDLMGIAQTGTGKTAAFALPILHHLLAARLPLQARTTRVLVLSPTRELAAQIAESFLTYGKGLGFLVGCLYGGVKYGPQYKMLASGLDVLVATPGRLIDHLEQKTIDFKNVSHFVLDEADQMMDMGFIKPIRQILSRLPQSRQTLFFSATMPPDIAALAADMLKDPVRISITPQATTADQVTQQVLFVEAQRKRALLTELFAEDALSRTLVFTRTKRSADRVAAYLQAGGVQAAAIHGDKTQSQRERALGAFREGRLRALVATDIAARGIDVDQVSHVINFELPNVPEAYVHRIGRTARAGRSGMAITLCADDERRLLKQIERIIRKPIPSWDRRRDAGLALMDAAILASGQTEKPSTPERNKPPRHTPSSRHSDPDAERGPRRQRPKKARPGPRGEVRTAAPPKADYDPLATDRSSALAAPFAEGAGKPFGRGPRPNEASAKPKGGFAQRAGFKARRPKTPDAKGPAFDARAPKGKPNIKPQDDKPAQGAGAKFTRRPKHG